MPSVLAFLLLPFAWLYAGVLAVRNWLYEAGWKKSVAFAVPLINVGNLRVGGTGKTPHVIWLLEELLRQGHRPAVLSRGYGRRTRGPRLTNSTDSAATVGDEPWQYFQQFASQNVPVAVAEARRLGIELLLRAHPKTTVIVLDDAYQHRAVRPALNLLLTEWARPFYQDLVLPAGRLRESRSGARRADIIIVTKCPPDLDEASQIAIEQRIRHYGRANVLVLFSAYAYSQPKAFAPEIALSAADSSITSSVEPARSPALLLTGIAQPGPLREYLESQGYLIQHHAAFPDHHAFQATDLVALRAHWQPSWAIFTTEKDATRLQSPELRAALAGLPLYTIPVRVTFLGNGGAALRHLLPRVLMPGI
ncbi:tetraacyldisaccharide 4'-kinase [Hymenobacter terrenus]|uniref:tetraacyldisaccharide 4'-kinase n=1 Tax=Hymenobacter terrenus TaxID=1629124 RepID=UPI0006197B1F|nr:tetraacyldisaccharide 4'-kinase [Hymenobacter terrenus]